MHKAAAVAVATLTSVVLAGCPEKKEDYTQQKPEDVTGPEARESAPPPKPKKKGPPAELGTCNLEVSGGITAKIEAKGGASATNISYWYLPEERKNMMGVDGYVVNCNGEGGVRFSLLPGGGRPDGMPFQPKKFTFAKGKADGANVMAAFGQATLADANGTVEITALDKRHIAGTVDLTGKVVPGNKQIKITGSFDFICPGLSACEFE